jgi:tRNA A37 threonylcarbamoyltransferase TsaD
MRSSPVFARLEDTLTELDRAIASFTCDVAPLSESISFVGLETNLLNIQSVIAKALKANREVRRTICEQLQSEILSDYISKRRPRRAAYRLVSDGG